MSIGFFTRWVVRLFVCLSWKEDLIGGGLYSLRRRDASLVVVTFWWETGCVLKRLFFLLYGWESIWLFWSCWKCLLLILRFDLECCEGVKRKIFVYFCRLNERSTEADGYDSTECTSVLWTRCLMETDRSNAMSRVATWRRKIDIECCEGVKKKNIRLLLLF